MSDVQLCDRCHAILGADGVRAVHKDGRELLLCRVHERDHAEALKRQGWSILPLIVPDPVAGPRISRACERCQQATVTRVVTASPTSVPVEIVKCQGCDQRTCNTTTSQGKCAAQPQHPEDPICPKGHPLNGAGL